MKLLRDLRFVLETKGLKVEDLGVLIDCNLSFNNHVKTITMSAFYHLKNIAKLRGLMSKHDLEKLIHAFMSSRVDYCNGLYVQRG